MPVLRFSSSRDILSARIIHARIFYPAGYYVLVRFILPWYILSYPRINYPRILYPTRIYYTILNLLDVHVMMYLRYTYMQLYHFFMPKEQLEYYTLPYTVYTLEFRDTNTAACCKQCCRGQPWPSGSRQKLPIVMLTVSDREPPTCLAV